MVKFFKLFKILFEDRLYMLPSLLCTYVWFYGMYILTLVLGATLVASDVNLVSLNIAIEVMNALLLPIVLGFLFLLAVKALPEEHKLKGAYFWTVLIVLGITAALGVYGGIWGL